MGFLCASCEIDSTTRRKYRDARARTFPKNCFMFGKHMGKRRKSLVMKSVHRSSIAWRWPVGVAMTGCGVARATTFCDMFACIYMNKLMSEEAAW